MIDPSPVAEMEDENGHTGKGKPSEELQKVSRATLFRMLSILWIFPSLGAGWILAGDFKRWFKSESVSAAIAVVKIEEWVAVLLLLLHAIFIFLALRYRVRAREDLTARGSSGT